MVPPSLLKMLISPSKHVTLIFVKSWLAPSPQFTYSVIHAQTNTRIHACLECPRSAGLTGMNERGALAPRPLSQGPLAVSLLLCRSLACSPALSVCRGETVLRLSPAAPLHHPPVLHPLPCRFRIEEPFREVHITSESQSRSSVDKRCQLKLRTENRDTQDTAESTDPDCQPNLTVIILMDVFICREETVFRLSPAPLHLFIRAASASNRRKSVIFAAK